MKRSRLPAKMTRFAEEQTHVRLKAVTKEWRRAARSPHDEDAIHDLRVAIRRLLQCLTLFESLFGARAAADVGRPLKKLLDHCGEVRNCDIALELLTEAGLDSGKAASNLRRLRRRREKDLAGRLARPRPRRRLKSQGARLKASEHSQTRPWEPDATVFENASRALPALTEEFLAAGAAAARPEADHETMHQFRLLAKRLRYTLEVFSPVYGQGLKQALTALSGLQDRLGAINDCVTSRRLLKGDRKARRAIRELIPGREAEFRSYWRHRFPSESQAAWREWITAAPETGRGRAPEPTKRRTKR